VRAQGHPVLGAINGFFLGMFVALDLLFFGVVQLDSVFITILPIVGIVVGIALGYWGPLGRSRA
jgi:putative flippase GtrA